MAENQTKATHLLSDSDISEVQELLERLAWRPEPRPRTSTSKRGYATAMAATLDEVAAELGVTRERARQLEVKALKKCRLWCQARGYRLDDLLPGAAGEGDR